jgi:hypothetical protein
MDPARSGIPPSEPRLHSEDSPAASVPTGAGGWLAVLILLLTVWNPASLALQAASSVWSLGSRSTFSLVLFGSRLAITSVGVGAGLALWRRRPGAVWLAKLALILFGIESVVRLSTRVDLSRTPPGMRLPTAIIIVLHNAGWYWYLETSRRVRATYGLESQP